MAHVVEAQQDIRPAREDLPDEAEVRADEAEVGEPGPRVAHEENHRREREDEVRNHGEAADRSDGGTEIGERDGEDGKQFRFSLFREPENPARPRQQQERAEKRARVDVELLDVGRAVKRVIEAGQPAARERARVDDHAAAGALEPEAARDEADADRSEDGQLAPWTQVLVEVLVNIKAEGDDRDEREDDADPRQPAAELKLAAQRGILVHGGGLGRGWQRRR